MVYNINAFGAAKQHDLKKYHVCKTAAMDRLLTMMDIRAIPLKRYSLLISIVLPIVVIGVFDSTNYQIIMSVFISIVIIFINFPIMSKILHMRPLYYEDLVDDTKVPQLENLSKERFQNIFVSVQMFVLAIAFAILFDYILVRIHDAKLNYIEMGAFIGGFITIYQKASTLFGKLIISGLYWKKKQELESRRQKSQSIVELVDIDINVGDFLEGLEIEMTSTSYEKYHCYMINNMNNTITVDTKNAKSNEIVQMKIQEVTNYDTINTLHVNDCHSITIDTNIHNSTVYDTEDDTSDKSTDNATDDALDSEDNSLHESHTVEAGKQREEPSYEKINKDQEYSQTTTDSQFDRDIIN